MSHSRDTQTADEALEKYEPEAADGPGCEYYYYAPDEGWGYDEGLSHGEPDDTT